MRYVNYDEAASVPNVVIDGSPNPGTVLCLSHWPGIESPDHLRDDLSAQMAFHYVDSGMTLHGDAEVVTNNHFDQDGLVGVYALVAPGHAMSHRALLEDVAAAGDFGTYRDRRAARISAVISAWGMATTPADPYPVALERLPHLLEDVEAYRALWEDEDNRLGASEEALAAGAIRIVDEPDLDLAVVTVDDGVAPTWGQRFTGQRFDGVHPMAVHNATDMSGIALLHGQRFQFTHRYETWVQYRSRPRRRRVALLPLARELSAVDTVAWRADAVGALTPTLSHEGDSSMSAADFLGRLRHHLATAPPAWDPAVGRQREGEAAG